MTHHWLDAQNSPSALVARAASDALWGKTQQTRAIQLAAVVGLPTALALISAWNKDTSSVAAFFGFVMTLLDTGLINPYLVRKRRLAAQEQDRFDEIAFHLPRPNLRKADDLEISIAHEIASDQQVGRANRNMDWYSPVLGQLPISAGRIACMRESLVWDGGLRSRWTNLIAAIAVCGGLLYVAIGLWLGMNGPDLIERILFPLLPALAWAIREWREQRDACAIVESLRVRLRETWDLVVKRSIPDDILLETTIQLSAAINSYRASIFPVPNVIYMWLRNKQIDSSSSAAAEFVRAFYRREVTRR